MLKDKLQAGAEELVILPIGTVRAVQREAELLFRTPQERVAGRNYKEAKRTFNEARQQGCQHILPSTRFCKQIHAKSDAREFPFAVAPTLRFATDPICSSI